MKRPLKLAKDLYNAGSCMEQSNETHNIHSMSSEQTPSTISIIIPVYNRARDLEACLKSIRAQSFNHYETIIIDDASTEDLRPIIASCDIYIRNNVNLGPAYSRNLGVLRSRGEILLFLDSDVELLPDTLQKLPAVFSRHPEIGGIGGEGPSDESGKDVHFSCLIYYDRFGRKTTKKLFPPKENSRHEIIQVDIVASAFLAVPRRRFFQAGGFDPFIYYMCEDRDLCFALKAKGGRIVVSSDIRAIHHYSKEGNPTRGFDHVQWLKFYSSKALEVALKWGGFWGGVVWLFANFRISSRPVYWPTLFRQLANFKKFKARKNKNFLSADEMEAYSQEHFKNQLKKQAHFDIQFPLPAPRQLTLFVTTRCNAVCDHCFISGVSTGANDMTSHEIIRLCASAKNPLNVILTGGEPFLRDDFSEILSGLMELENIMTVSVASNGFLSEKIRDICMLIAGRYRKPLHVQISLDGLGRTHDAIRKVQDGFQRTMQTCEALSQIHKAHPHFAYVVNICIMKTNIHEIPELIAYLIGKNIPSKLAIVRGNSYGIFNAPASLVNMKYNPRGCVALSATEIRTLLEAIDREYSGYFDVFQKRKLDTLLKTMELKSPQIPCYAGYQTATVFSDGSIALCEPLHPFGHLSRWDWDLTRAWNSRESMEQRLQLFSCACLDGCNVNYSLSRIRSRGKAS